MNPGGSSLTLGDVGAVSGATRRSIATQTVLAFAVVLGALYTFSPMAVWFGVWMACLLRLAATGTRGAERRWLLGVLGVALGLRVVAIGVLPFQVDPAHHEYATYFGDALYAIQRSIWMRNAFLGVPIAARDYIEAFEPVFGWSGYTYVLAFCHVLFGPSPYGIALFSTGLFLTAAVMLYRRCRRGFGAVAALVGLTVLLFVPSWFAWSVAPLKEAMQSLLLTAVVLGTDALLRESGAARARAVVAVAAAIVVSGTIRNGGTAIAALGAGLGAGLWLVTRRWWPGAVLAIVVPIAALLLSANATIRSVTIATVTEAAARHLGHERSEGLSYRLLDSRFYDDTLLGESGEAFGLTFGEGARFLGRSVIAFFVVPLPWQLASAPRLVIVPQQVLWYMLVALSLYGLASALRRDATLTCALVGMILAVVIVIAPNSGNIGTLIRHRDMAVPFVCALAGWGALAMAARAGRTRPI